MECILLKSPLFFKSFYFYLQALVDNSTWGGGIKSHKKVHLYIYCIQLGQTQANKIKN